MRKIKQVFPSKHCSTWIQKENIATELFFFTSVRVPGRSRSFGPLTFWKNAKKNTWQKQAWKNHFVGGNNSEKRYFSKHKSKKNKNMLWSYEVMKYKEYSWTNVSFHMNVVLKSLILLIFDLFDHLTQKEITKKTCFQSQIWISCDLKRDVFFEINERTGTQLT